MKRFALIAFASAVALGLAACGDSDDASEDAMADSVEMPADEGLAGTPDPVADLETQEDEESLEETEQTANEAADAAVETVDDVNAAVDAATRQAEETMD